MISFDHVTKNYGSLAAVDNVSLTVNQGEYLALLGPNGAGKTTLVRMLLGFSKPTQGTISLNGTSASHCASRIHLGFLAEQLRIPPYLSGREFLSRHATLKGLSGLEANKEIDRIVALVGMQGKEKKRSATYSKGMRQRIGLGAALLGKPKIVILDEPVSGLDPMGIRDFRTILEHLKDEGTTLILSSHLLSEVEKTCTTAAIIYKGKILVKDAIESIVKEGESLEDMFVRYIEEAHG